MDGSLVMDASRFTYQPMDFHVRLGFPMIAKLALGAVVMGFAGLVGLTRLILRRVMKASDAKIV